MRLGEVSGRRAASARPDPAVLSAERTAFFFDFDGTLVDIAERPEAVVVPPGLAAALGELSRRASGALAVLTGRPLATIDGWLAPLRLPGCGQHGVELRLPDGAERRSALHIDVAACRAALARAGTPPGVVVEDKGASVALHFRAAPEQRAAVEALAAVLLAAAGAHAVLKRGKCVVEVAPGGASKGSALGVLMAHAPFSGRVPAIFGDDLTDEDAFAAGRVLGGLAVQVGPREGARADVALAGPADVRRALGELAAGRTVSLRSP
jgi:trehalose 6-phosphate phosphatase